MDPQCGLSVGTLCEVHSDDLASHPGFIPTSHPVFPGQILEPQPPRPVYGAY